MGPSSKPDNKKFDENAEFSWSEVRKAVDVGLSDLGLPDLEQIGAKIESGARSAYEVGSDIVEKAPEATSAAINTAFFESPTSKENAHQALGQGIRQASLSSKGLFGVAALKRVAGPLTVGLEMYGDEDKLRGAVNGTTSFVAAAIAGSMAAGLIGGGLAIVSAPVWFSGIAAFAVGVGAAALAAGVARQFSNSTYNDLAARTDLDEMINDDLNRLGGFIKKTAQEKVINPVSAWFKKTFL